MKLHSRTHKLAFVRLGSCRYRRWCCVIELERGIWPSKAGGTTRKVTCPAEMLNLRSFQASLRRDSTCIDGISRLHGSHGTRAHTLGLDIITTCSGSGGGRNMDRIRRCFIICNQIVQCVQG